MDSAQLVSLSGRGYKNGTRNTGRETYPRPDARQQSLMMKSARIGHATACRSNQDRPPA